MSVVSGGDVGPVFLYRELFIRMAEMESEQVMLASSPRSPSGGKGKGALGKTYLAAGGYDDVSSCQENGWVMGHVHASVPQRQSGMAHGSERPLYTCSKEVKHKFPEARAYLERVKEEEEEIGEGGSHWSRETVAGSEMGRDGRRGGKKRMQETICERVKRWMFFSFWTLICVVITTGIVWGVARGL